MSLFFFFFFLMLNTHTIVVLFEHAFGDLLLNLILTPSHIHTHQIVSSAARDFPVDLPAPVPDNK